MHRDCQISISCDSVVHATFFFVVIMFETKLVSYTIPSPELVDAGLTSQDLVAYCARISNPGNQLNTETAGKLVNYLIRNKHWSPLEMVTACVEINTTRDIGRQILRHKSFSFQEFSQRYADPTQELQFVTREARLQDAKNRQNSLALAETTDEEKAKAEALRSWWQTEQEKIIQQAERVYVEAIRRGIAKEQARVVLPEGLTASRLLVTGNLRSWIHYIELRSGNGTQKEHMEIARMCAQVIGEIFPVVKDFVHHDPPLELPGSR